MGNAQVGRMRRKDKQMDRAEARRFLETSQVGRLGMVLPGGNPYVVPVNFIFMDGGIYFHSAREGSKVDAVAANPWVCFEVDESQGAEPAAIACDISYHYRSAIAFGKASPVVDPLRKKQVLEAIVSKYAPGAAGTIRQENVDRTLVFEISIDTMTGKQSPAQRRRDDATSRQ